MTFSKLLSLFPKKDVVVLSHTDAETDYLGFRFLTETCRSGDERILYLCHGDDYLKAISHGCGFNHVIIIGLPKEGLSGITDFMQNMACITGNMTLEDVVNLLSSEFSREMEELRASHSVMDSLTSNMGLQGIVDAAFPIFKNPIFILDVSGTCIAKRADEVEGLDSSYLDNDRIRHLATAYMDVSNDVRIIYNETMHAEMMLAPVRVTRVKVCYVFVFAIHHPFRWEDRTFMQSFTRIVTIEMQKDESLRANRGELKALLLKDLLNSTISNPSMIAKRLEELKIVLKSDLYIILVKMNAVPDDYDKGPSAYLEIIASQMRQFLPHCLYYIENSNLIILLHVDPGSNLKENIYTQLRHQAVVNRLSIGISNKFHDCTQAKRYYDQARKAIEIMIRYNSNKTADWIVSFFSLAAPAQLLQAASETEEIIHYCVPELMDLMNTDRCEGSDLMLTLYYYLEYFGKISSVTEQMHIHRNTLYYRLDKIKEVLHDDLKNGESIFRLMMSYRILIMLKVIDIPDILDVSMPYSGDLEGNR